MPHSLHGHAQIFVDGAHNVRWEVDLEILLLDYVDVGIILVRGLRLSDQIGGLDEQSTYSDGALLILPCWLLTPLMLAVLSRIDHNHRAITLQIANVIHYQVARRQLAMTSALLPRLIYKSIDSNLLGELHALKSYVPLEDITGIG